MNLRFPNRHRPLNARRSPRGFTLTEILIVIALVVVLIALAVPAFNFLTGSRSVDAAQNTISAFLARARTEAIGLQEIRGVFFYLEKSSDRIALALVREIDRPSRPGDVISSYADVVSQVDVFLDLVPESEFVVLPPGVTANTIDDYFADSTGQRTEDGFVGFNILNRGNGGTSPQDDTHTAYGGVILFDSSGRLITRHYAFKTYEYAPNGSRIPTRMGDLLYRPTGDLLGRDPTTVKDVVPLIIYPPSASQPRGPARSQLGLVLYDREALANAVPVPPAGNNRREWDWQFTDPGARGNFNQGLPSDENSEERWLDQNGLILLVNRYNGTLVKGE